MACDDSSEQKHICVDVSASCSVSCCSIHSITRLWYRLYRHVPTCPGPTHQNTQPLSVYMKETMACPCFRGLKGHSDPSCTQSFGIMTARWIPQISIDSTEVPSVNSHRLSFERGCACLASSPCLITYIFQYLRICLSVCPGMSVAWPVWVPEITHWQINGLSWPSSRLHAALCGLCGLQLKHWLWGSPAPKHRGLFCSYIGKKPQNYSNTKWRKMSETELWIITKLTLFSLCS